MKFEETLKEISLPDLKLQLDQYRIEVGQLIKIYKTEKREEEKLFAISSAQLCMLMGQAVESEIKLREEIS